MKPSYIGRLSSKLALLLTLVLANALLAQGQAKKTPPPPSNTQSKPAPAPQQHPTTLQPQRGGSNPGGNVGGNASVRGAGHAGADGANDAGPKAGNKVGGNVGGNTSVRGGGTVGAKSGNSAGSKIGNNVGGNAGGNASLRGGGNTDRKTGNSVGVNGSSTRPAAGRVIRPDGGATVRTSGGHTLEYGKGGHLDKVVTNRGTEAHFDARGKARTITTANGTTIFRGPAGQRHIVTEHRDANHRVESRVVSTGSNRGFVEHRMERGGHEYMRRTYVREGRTYVTVYRTNYYGGVAYYHYVPAYYYAPVYYGWAYNPWPAPVYYTWGWYGDPWYRPYGYYFAPYPAYPSAAFWLTDYLIAENLQAAYEAQTAANANAAAANADAAADNANAAAANAEAAAAQRGSQAGAVTLTPEVKQLIAEEVKAQLAADQAAATENGAANGAPISGLAQPADSAEHLPPALDPNLRVFIVTTSLDVTASGQACSLSPGDVLRRMDNSPDSNNTVGVIVLSSKQSDCGMDSSPRVQVADLQEMHNRFREQLDSGLKTLADNKGKKGIPSGPAVGGRNNPDGTAVPDDPAVVAAKLKQQQQEADQTEKEIQQAASPTGNARGNN